MSTPMTTPEQDKAEFEAYTQKHGRLPPPDHPTLGEASSYGRSGSTLGTGVLYGVAVTLAVIIAAVWFLR